MKALVFDTQLGSWEGTRGFELQDVPEPVLDETNNPRAPFIKGDNNPPGQPPLLRGNDPTDADKVLLKVHYAGICGTDRGIWNRAAFKDQILGSIKTEGKTRRILGHEFFGEVVALGSKAASLAPLSPLTKGVALGGCLKVGDFAAPESHVVCNKCFQCLRGEKHVCTNEKILGISHDGGFAEYVKLPAHIVWKTDTTKIRPELGALQEPFGNAVHAASKVPLKGKTIAIFGLGPIGLFLLLVARGLGAKSIIGIEPNPVSIEMAKRLGIDYVIPLVSSSSPARGEVPSPRGGGVGAAGRVISPNKGSTVVFDRRGVTTPALAASGSPFNNPPRLPPLLRGIKGDYHRDESVIKQIEELTNGLGVDVSFEMAGFNSSFNNAVFATRRGGDMIAFGIKTGDFVLEDYNRFIVRGLTIHAVIGRRLPETWETTQSLFADSTNKIQENIWNIILAQGKGTILPLRDYTKERFEEMMAKHPKLLIEI